MSLQIIKDGQGRNTGIFIPMNDWDNITSKHEDLKKLIPADQVTGKRKLSTLAGTLSRETVMEMHKYMSEGRGKY